MIIMHTFGTIARRLGEREEVKLEDFGKFEVKLRKGWSGLHPTSGKRVPIRDRFTVRFKPGKKLRRRIADSQD
jgi:nucleoid DNA-binding protein